MASKFRYLLPLALYLILGWAGITSAQETFTITGTVIQGTADGDPLPESVPLQLRMMNADGEVQQSFSAGSTANGSFEFTDVPRSANSFYVITTFWSGIEQTTIPATADQITQPIEFKLYNTTDSLTNVVANRGNLRVEFEDVNAVGIEMLLELNYINIGDRIILSESGVQIVELPVGTFGIAIESAPGEIQRYSEIDSFPIPGVRDTQPLIPGVPNIMRVSFLVPYEEGAVIDMRFPFPITDLGVFVREETVVVESSLLILNETQETSTGRRYDVYTVQEALERSEPFKFTLTGKPTITVRNPTTTRIERDSSFSAIVIALVVGAFIALAGVFLWLLRTRAIRETPQ